MPQRDQEAIRDRFRDWYSVRDDVLAEVEREVIGADCGANGYTTLAQVRVLVERLGLGPHQQVLDIGTGRGWPALYMAVSSGCSVVGADVPLEGLVTASRRAHQERIADRTRWVNAAAEAMPFRPQSFHAIVHTDTLC